MLSQFTRLLPKFTLPNPHHCFVTIKCYSSSAEAKAITKPKKMVDNPDGCQLAESLTDKIKKPFVPNREYLVEPKFDGVRLLTHLNEDGSFQMYSRNGLKYHYFHGAFKGEIEKLHKHILMHSAEKEYVIDGELMSSDQSFGSVVGLGHSSNISRDMPLHYFVFDLILKSDYKDTGKKYTQAERKKFLEIAIPNTDTEISTIYYIQGQKVVVARVPHITRSFPDKKTVMELVNEYKSKGYEGLILKNPKSLHIRKRHAGIIKAKTSDTYDLKITGFKIVKGELKQLVLTSKNSKTVNVGNGMSDGLKAEVCKNPAKYLGQIVEVSALSISGNSLRFATFIKFRPDKSEPDLF